MQVLDLNTDPSIEPLLGMLRALTRLDSSHDILGEFMAQYSRFRPIDAYVGIVPVKERTGAYRISYAVHRDEAVNGKLAHTRDMNPEVIAMLPIIEEGFFTPFIADESPKMVHDIAPIDEPGVTAIIAGLTSVMALPIFRNGTLAEWSFAFGRVPLGAVQPKDVGQATVTANLLGATNHHADMVKEIRRLNATLSEQIEAIARVQQSLLPSDMPRIKGIEIATSYLTSDAAGGDYFDFFNLPGGKLGLLVADVSGHGAAAATVMAMLHAILHAFDHGGGAMDDPFSVMAFANRRLAAARLEGSFVTAFYGILDPATGQMVYCNCGHNPPRLLRTARGTLERLDHDATIPLGVLDQLPPHEISSVTLTEGDLLILYTDGVTEAFGADGTMFGELGIDSALMRGRGVQTPDDVVLAIHHDLFNHTRQRARRDDQTIVALRWSRGSH
ncbi:MAG: PP2C family protein-serine/threonine phosphatase [Planctomycetota bacterium]|nr:PP2C family protein-serine/threonine phosphatase [Planctomycetota bacterium]